ncbi:MAG: DUF721 domain-containing protein [Muribaculaceae bacterium]|nr:DUF721 domain-containing protein [Muribaculaceae bacterium]
MKRRYPTHVGFIISQAIEASGQQSAFDRHKACYVWSEIVGPNINRLTTRRWIDRDALHVVIASGPLKTELAFMADAIVRRINEAVGSEIISRLIIH